MKTLSQIIESSESSSLSNFIFEGKTYTENKKDILKALGVGSWDKSNYSKGIWPKVTISQVRPAKRGSSNPGQQGYFAKLYNDKYDKIVIYPNLTYVKPADYENRVINNLDKLGTISGCSYQIIDKGNYEKITGQKIREYESEKFPMVIISIPKDESSKPELPGIPNKKDDLKPEDKQKTEPKAEKSKDKSIQFWCTGAGDTRYDYVAYGAMTPDWTPNFKRIQKRIGENKFRMYYTNLPTKKFTSYKSLYKYMKNKWKNKYSEFSIATEDKLIELASEESYYIKDYWS